MCLDERLDKPQVPACQQMQEPRGARVSAEHMCAETRSRWSREHYRHRQSRQHYNARTSTGLHLQALQAPFSVLCSDAELRCPLCRAGVPLVPRLKQAETCQKWQSKLQLVRRSSCQQTPVQVPLCLGKASNELIHRSPQVTGLRSPPLKTRQNGIGLRPG